MRIQQMNSLTQGRRYKRVIIVSRQVLLLHWTTFHYECTNQRRRLDRDEAKILTTDHYSSNLFWKGNLSSYLETIDIIENLTISPDSFHSVEDDEEQDHNESTQEDMTLSKNIFNFNKKIKFVIFIH